MRIALASPPYPHSINDALSWADQLVKEAKAKEADLICFPESFIPGYPAAGYDPEQATQKDLQAALDHTCELAADNHIAIILPMDWHTVQGFQNVAQVISKKGEILGLQAKNQLDPGEDTIWSPGNGRKIFEVDGVKFGISICHEGFRYPETVRWAARKGAQIVFHPHFAGSDTAGKMPLAWGSMDNPYYEKAMMMRALENTIYFASSNNCFAFPESASSVIDPQGKCIAFQPYGISGVLVADIDPGRATGMLAKRFKPENLM